MCVSVVTFIISFLQISATDLRTTTQKQTQEATESSSNAVKLKLQTDKRVK